MKIVVALIAALTLTGCGIAAKVEARNEYRESAERYKECLIANSSRPQQCEGLRLAMEADERKYNNMSAGLTPGAQRSANVTIMSR